jgi:hypothetical protein
MKTPSGSHVFYPIKILLTFLKDCLLRKNSAEEFLIPITVLREEDLKDFVHGC